MDMAYETLTEATQSSEQCAVQLFFAVRNIFELFCSVIPTFHRENLLKFPQHSGIIIIYFILLITDLKRVYFCFEEDYLRIFQLKIE